MAGRQRRSADAEASKTVKLSIPIGVRDHARLCGVAALRGVTISTFAADAIRTALRGVTLIDRHGSADPADRAESSGQEKGSAIAVDDLNGHGEIAA